jgi:hypothetical protein
MSDRIASHPEYQRRRPGGRKATLPPVSRRVVDLHQAAANFSAAHSSQGRRPETCRMNPAYMTALSALGGSLVGGITTGITTWMSLRSAARAGRLGLEFSRRQDLFRDFIVAASSAYGHALISSEPQIQELVNLYAMISRMRILCSPELVACADKIMRLTIETNFAPNKTVAELRDMVQSETGLDPLKEFSERARRELAAFKW